MACLGVRTYMVSYETHSLVLGQEAPSPVYIRYDAPRSVRGRARASDATERSVTKAVRDMMLDSRGLSIYLVLGLLVWLES